LASDKLDNPTGKSRTYQSQMIVKTIDQLATAILTSKKDL